uniref:SH3 domain binding glutamate rich protein like 2 n=1 Tax=Naja naja TaxID=35670 RepID=A0A8C6XHP8_NAJNA
QPARHPRVSGFLPASPSPYLIPGALLPPPLTEPDGYRGSLKGVTASPRCPRIFTAGSKIKKRQQDIVRFLEANKIDFEEVDITMSEDQRRWMYKNIPQDKLPAQGNPLPPQIFSNDEYCGDYDSFFESKESNTVFTFLRLKSNLASQESEP